MRIYNYFVLKFKPWMRSGKRWNICSKHVPIQCTMMNSRRRLMRESSQNHLHDILNALLHGKYG